MIEQRDLDLLADLVALLKKHGPDAFERLAINISSPELASRLADLLQGTARAARAAPKRTGKTSGVRPKGRLVSLKDLLQSLKAKEPEKYELISAFNTSFLAGEVLPSMRDVRDFADNLGLRLHLTSRDKVLSPLARALAKLPTDEMAAQLRRAKTSQQGDRDLAGWTDIILRRGVNKPIRR